MTKDRSARKRIVLLGSQVTDLRTSVRRLNTKYWALVHNDQANGELIKQSAENIDEIAKILNRLVDRMLESEARLNEAEDAGRI